MHAFAGTGSQHMLRHKGNAVVTYAGLRQADAVLLIFTLAAVAPQEMVAMLHTAFQVLTCLCVFF